MFLKFLRPKLVPAPVNNNKGVQKMISDKSVNFLKALEKQFTFLNADEMTQEIEKNDDLKKLDKEISDLKAIKKIFEK